MASKSQHRKDNVGELIKFVRTHSNFYRESLREVPVDATSVEDLPIVNSEEYWKANASKPNGVVTTNLNDATVMRSGGSTGTPKMVYMTTSELKIHAKVGASAVAQGVGIFPGDRVANLSHHGSLYGSFMLFNTIMLELPIPIVHLPISGNGSIEEMVHHMETHDATVLMSNVATTRRIAEFMTARGKTMPKLHLILYSGERFTKELRPIYRAAFPNSIIYPIEYGCIDAGLIGIPGKPFQHDDDDIDPVYKVVAPLIILEILDENGKPIREPDIKGSAVVTSLIRRQQPLLRYPIGDIVSWVDYEHETFRVHGRDSVGLKISSTHLPLTYLRGMIKDVLGAEDYTGSQFIVKRVNGTHEQVVVFRIVAPKPVNAHEINEIFEKRLTEESGTWGKNRTVGNVAALQIEWIEGKDLIVNSATGKLKDIVDERF